MDIVSRICKVVTFDESLKIFVMDQGYLAFGYFLNLSSISDLQEIQKEFEPLFQLTLPDFSFIQMHTIVNDSVWRLEHAFGKEGSAADQSTESLLLTVKLPYSTLNMVRGNVSGFGALMPITFLDPLASVMYPSKDLIKQQLEIKEKIDHIIEGMSILSAPIEAEHVMEHLLGAVGVTTTQETSPALIKSASIQRQVFDNIELDEKFDRVDITVKATEDSDKSIQCYSLSHFPAKGLAYLYAELLKSYEVDRIPNMVFTSTFLFPPITDGDDHLTDLMSQLEYINPELADVLVLQDEKQATLPDIKRTDIIKFMSSIVVTGNIKEQELFQKKLKIISKKWLLYFSKESSYLPEKIGYTLPFGASMESTTLMDRYAFLLKEKAHLMHPIATISPLVEVPNMLITAHGGLLRGINFKGKGFVTVDHSSVESASEQLFNAIKGNYEHTFVVNVSDRNTLCKEEFESLVFEKNEHFNLNPEYSIAEMKVSEKIHNSFLLLIKSIISPHQKLNDQDEKLITELARQGTALFKDDQFTWDRWLKTAKINNSLWRSRLKSQINTDAKKPFIPFDGCWFDLQDIRELERRYLRTLTDILIRLSMRTKHNGKPHLIWIRGLQPTENLTLLFDILALLANSVIANQGHLIISQQESYSDFGDMFENVLGQSVFKLYEFQDSKHSLKYQYVMDGNNKALFNKILPGKDSDHVSSAPK